MAQFLLVTDLDNTLVGDGVALQQLNAQLEAHRQQYGTRLVYATGRSATSYQQLRASQVMLHPDALVASVGTEIYLQGNPTPDPAWAAKLEPGWDRQAIVAIGAHFADLVPQAESEQRPFKVSYLLTEAAAQETLPQLRHLLRQQGLDVQLIYSSGIDLDILPRGANKGLAMAYLRQHWGVDADRTVACGDSGNDLALFASGDELGIIVGNARPELLQWHQANPSPRHYLAKAECAAGILEGLRHFGFL